MGGIVANEVVSSEQNLAPEWIVQSLQRLRLIESDESPLAVPLAGGVSSDIWRVALPRGDVCVKRALARLRVEADWRAPVERNHYEAEWMRVVANRVPGRAPEVLAEDREAGLFVMDYLEPNGNPVWKSVLKGGVADADFATCVGEAIAKIHASTAGDKGVQRRFPTGKMFHDLRLEPYLMASARRWPDLASALSELAERTAATHKALVHGDVSPKNILVGACGPILLDAECAWYGDPAFDLAFCLNHLLLKCLWVPEHTHAYLACFDALASAYRRGVDWEPAADLERRVASLVPGLLLARVDGKSPVEYVRSEEQKATVRGVARALLLDPPARLDTVRGVWMEELER